MVVVGGGGGGGGGGGLKLRVGGGGVQTAQTRVSYPPPLLVRRKIGNVKYRNFPNDLLNGNF